MNAQERYYYRHHEKELQRQKKWRDNNRELYRQIQRVGRMKYAHGLTREQYMAISQAQDNVCAICKQPETMWRRGRLLELHIDHDHATGKIRGLLCHHCNVGLGHFRDNTELLQRATNYLCQYKN